MEVTIGVDQYNDLVTEYRKTLNNFINAEKKYENVVLQNEYLQELVNNLVEQLQKSISVMQGLN